MGLCIKTLNKILVLFSVVLLSYTSAYPQNNTICNPMLVKKCTLPFGSWEMTSAQLVDLVHAQENVVGGVRTRVDTIYGVTNTTGIPSQTIIQRTIGFADAQNVYSYVFTDNGARLESATFLVKASNTKSAIEDFDKGTKPISSSNTINKKNSTYLYTMVCGAYNVSIVLGKSKTDQSRIVLMYSLVTR